MTQTSPILMDICGSDVRTSANIRYLGVYLDSTMSMTTHVTRICRTAYGRLRNIERIRSSLPLLACKTLVHALVTSTLDSGNAALFGITGTLLHRLEMVQRAAARVVLCIDRRDHRSMTAALRERHWLHIAQIIQCNVLTLMHGAVHNRTPRYISDRIVTHAPSRSLRSATNSLVAVPRINMERYGRRSFSCAGPSLWNALPFFFFFFHGLSRHMGSPV